MQLTGCVSLDRPEIPGFFYFFFCFLIHYKFTKLSASIETLNIVLGARCILSISEKITVKEALNVILKEFC